MDIFSALLAICEGFPLKKASDSELRCLFGSAPKQTIEKPVIWDAITLIITSL